MAKNRAEYVVQTPEAYIADVLAHLNRLGAWFDDLQAHDADIRLRFRVPEQNMHGFAEWLKRATNGTGRVFKNVH